MQQLIMAPHLLNCLCVCWNLSDTVLVFAINQMTNKDIVSHYQHSHPLEDTKVRDPVTAEVTTRTHV